MRGFVSADRYFADIRNLFVFYFKILHALCDISLSITFAKSSTRGNEVDLLRPIAAVLMFGNIF